LDRLIYLACPHAHPDPAVRAQRFHAVSKAAAKLLGEGELVLSPVSHSTPISAAGDLPGGWDYWGKLDRVLLSCCHKMIVLKLDGWEESAGVNAEIKIAETLGIPVIYMEPV
jgi:hypothetical protein